MRICNEIRPWWLSGLLVFVGLLLAACAVVPVPLPVQGEAAEMPAADEAAEMPAGEEEAQDAEETPTPEPYQPDAEVIASGLRQPRQLNYGADGTLYIAEAGLAGDSLLPIDPEQSVMSGLSARISAVSPNGEQSVAVVGLPSIQTRPGNTGFRGAQALLVTEDSYWIGFGEPPVALFGLTPFQQVLQIDRETMRPGVVIDTATPALEAQQPEPDAVNSDPVDLAMADDGTLFIADAGCNCLWTWTEADGLDLFHGWDIDDNPVPTGVDFGPEGDIYVSFLSGFPFPVEGTRIERWSRDGELLQTYEGLTLLTDVLVTDDGTIYAVQMASGLGDQGFNPDSGSVVMVSEDGITPVIEGLRLPYAVAQAPDGSLAVSLVSSGDTAEQGLVIRVPVSE